GPAEHELERFARLPPSDPFLEQVCLVELVEEQPRLVLGEHAPRRTQPGRERGELLGVHAHAGHQTAERTRTRASSSSELSGVPSARSAARARARCRAGTRPSAVTTRHHGASSPARDIAVPTWRGPPHGAPPAATNPSATISATSP